MCAFSIIVGLVHRRHRVKVIGATNYPVYVIYVKSRRFQPTYLHLAPC